MLLLIENIQPNEINYKLNGNIIDVNVLVKDEWVSMSFIPPKGKNAFKFTTRLEKRLKEFKFDYDVLSCALNTTNNEIVLLDVEKGRY